LIKWALEGTFGAIEKIGTPLDIKNENNESYGVSENEFLEDADEEFLIEPTETYLVMGCVIIRYTPRARQLELEWEGNLMNDGVADAVMAVLLTVESSPASVKHSSNHKYHDHDHDHGFPEIPNPHANHNPEERLSRLLMILEAQFGSNIAPIERPRLQNESFDPAVKNGIPTPGHHKHGSNVADLTPESNVNGNGEDKEKLAEMEAAEIDRLRSLGIPVPGIEIKVDKHVARVWLEHLEVECSYPVLKDRVRVVVERAVETVSGMWTEDWSSSTNGHGVGKGALDEMETGVEIRAEA